MHSNNYAQNLQESVSNRTVAYDNSPSKSRATLYVPNTKKIQKKLTQLAMEDVRSFLEAGLLITQYFYRKSINLGEEKFAFQIIEMLTQQLFTANDSAVFKLFLKFYRIKYLDDIKVLTQQQDLYSNLTLKDMNVTLMAEVMPIQPKRQTINLHRRSRSRQLVNNSKKLARSKTQNSDKKGSEIQLKNE